MISLRILALYLQCFAVFVNSELEEECPNQFDDFFEAQIIPFFFPHQSEAVRGQIGLYYYNPRFEYGDKIILISNNACNSNVTLKNYTIYHKRGTIATEVELPDIIPGSPIFTPDSLGICAYWERNQSKSKKFCITTRPTWMYELKDIIEDQKISSIIIPGTHQSGAYLKIYPQSLVNRFAVAQDQDVLEQLIFGVRYLDLRPAYKYDKFYNEHGPFFMVPMQKIVDDINTFLDNTQEIVIVSFKEFAIGFEEEEIHEKFIEYLNIQFSNHILPRSPHKLWNITLNEIWTLKRRLIISYSDRVFFKNWMLWPPIYQAWGNVAPEGDMKAFIKDAEAYSRNPMATMAAYTIQQSQVATYTVQYLIGGNPPSLRSLAISIGPLITIWYNEEHFKTARIIAVDYIQSTGIVEVAIEWNKRRFSPCYDIYKQLYHNENYTEKPID